MGRISRCLDEMGNGPFGNYPEPCIGRLMNQLVRCNSIPLTTVERMIFSSSHMPGEGAININNKQVGNYRWFGNVALVLWSGEMAVHNRQEWAVFPFPSGGTYPMFHLSLSVHHQPCFEISGKDATPELHQFLTGTMLTNRMDHPCYKLSNDAGAFFQGGADAPDGEWFMIEFSSQDLSKCQAWLDHLNQHYRPVKES
jgi:hypothetical protein